MPFSNIKIVVRSLIRNKFYSLSIIAGFSVSIASFYLIFSFLWKETSVDDQHHDSKSLYRVLQWNPVLKTMDINVSRKISDYLKSNYAEVEKLTDVVYPGWTFIKVGTETFKEKRVLIVDSQFPEIFNFKLIMGSPGTCLSNPHSVLLSESTAVKYFGDDNPLGKMIDIKGDLYQVSGVIEDVQRTSHLRFDLLLSSTPFKEPLGRGFVYVVLRHNAPLQPFVVKLNKDLSTLLPDNSKSLRRNQFQLQSIKTCYFTFPQSYQADVFFFRDQRSLNQFAVIMVLLLIISCFNFINFSQAKGLFDAKRIILSRVLGATVRSTIAVFIGEAFLLSMAALLLSLVLISFLLPVFNHLTDSFLTIQFLLSAQVVSACILIFVLVAGSLGYVSYWVFSKVHVTQLTGVHLITHPKRLKLLNGLVVMQLAVAIVLSLIGVALHAQMDFLDIKPLQFRTHNMLDIDLMNLSNSQNPVSLKNEVMRLPGVKSASICMGTPLVGRGHANIELDGEMRELNWMEGDLDYINTLGLKIVAGRRFKSGADSTFVILNQTALKYSHLGNELQPLEADAPKNVIGVVRDFNFNSLYEKIEPVEIHLSDAKRIRRLGAESLLVNTEGDNPSLIARIANIWKSLYPDAPFDYSLVDETYSNIYQKERNYTKLVIACAFESILISCFGLIGISYFAGFRRMREIAIRKVHGATSESVLLLVLKSTVTTSLIAWTIGIPVAFYFIGEWLNNFAYKTQMPYLLFSLTLILLLVVTISSVLTQAINAAYRPPSVVLKNE